MKNLASGLKKQMISRYLTKDTTYNTTKSTDINILLNRIELNKRNESRKKLYFSAAASTGLILFAFILF